MRSCARCATASASTSTCRTTTSTRSARGEDATAVAYVQLRIGADRTVYGVGLDPNIVTATLKAVVSAVNRAVGAGRPVVAEGGERQAAALA